MKLRVAAVILACLLLAGCAPMLERSYSAQTPHVQFSDEEENPAILRAESYQGIVSAVLHLVSLGEESGVIRLYHYISVKGGAASDLDAACLEVTQQDPLGAYAVDYIKYDVTQTATYYEVSVKLAYRRTPEQIAAVVSVTGSSAIAGEMREIFRQQSQEAAFRISYFTANDSAETIRLAVEEAYAAQYGSAEGCPTVKVTLYPETGSQRLAEILLTWPPVEFFDPVGN